MGLIILALVVLAVAAGVYRAWRQTTYRRA